MMNFYDVLEQAATNQTRRKLSPVQQQIESIIRNLNKVLNLTKTDQRLLKNRKALGKSVFNIGIADFTHLYAYEELHREQIRRSLLETINTYESRLKNVEVRLEEPINTTTIKVSIKGQISEETFLHWVEFYGHLNLSTGNFPIKV